MQNLSKVDEKKVPLATCQADLSDTPNVKNLKSVDEKNDPLPPGREVSMGSPNVQNPKFVDEKEISLPTGRESEDHRQKCRNQYLLTKTSSPKTKDPSPRKVQNLNFVDEKKEIPASGREDSAISLNVQSLKFVDEKKEPPLSDQEDSAISLNVQNSRFVDEKKKIPASVREDSAISLNVHNFKFVDEKTSLQFENLRSQILDRKELITRDGSVVASWKTYRGKRLGPYYRLAYRENREARTLYIGRDEQLATMVSELIDELKNPLRQNRVLRQIRAAVKAGLRRSLAEAEALAAPLGYRRRGYSFHKQR